MKLTPLKPTRRERFLIWLFGRVEVGTRFEAGWSKPMKLYLSKCPKHGYFEDNLHGFEDYMTCPECFGECTPLDKV